jgi:hypothetical protein
MEDEPTNKADEVYIRKPK